MVSDETIDALTELYVRPAQRQAELIRQHFIARGDLEADTDVWICKWCNSQNRLEWVMCWGCNKE